MPHTIILSALLVVLLVILYKDVRYLISNVFSLKSIVFKIMTCFKPSGSDVR